MIYVCSHKGWHSPVDAAGCQFPRCGAPALQIDAPDPEPAPTPEAKPAPGAGHDSLLPPPTPEPPPPELPPLEPAAADAAEAHETIRPAQVDRLAASPVSKPTVVTPEQVDPATIIVTPRHGLAVTRARLRLALPGATLALILLAALGSSWVQSKRHPTELSRLPVQRVLGQKLDPWAIKAEADRRWRAGQQEEAVLLLEEAARRGSGAAYAELATFYDPNEPLDPAARLRPDARAAARYYRDAAKAGTDVTKPREQLRESLVAKSAAGDMLAGLTLKDFWP